MTQRDFSLTETISAESDFAFAEFHSPSTEADFASAESHSTSAEFDVASANAFVASGLLIKRSAAVSTLFFRRSEHPVSNTALQRTRRSFPSCCRPIRFRSRLFSRRIRLFPVPFGRSGPASIASAERADRGSAGAAFNRSLRAFTLRDEARRCPRR
jgi:hypothetical protein